MGWQKMTVRRDAAWNEVLAEDAEKKEEAGTTDSGDWLEGITERMATASLLSSTGGSSKMDVADDDAVQPITEICSAELKTHLHRLVDQLPPDTAQLIRDTYFQGMTMQEAAANLGCQQIMGEPHARQRTPDAGRTTSPYGSGRIVNHGGFGSESTTVRTLNTRFPDAS